MLSERFSSQRTLLPSAISFLLESKLQSLTFSKRAHWKPLAPDIPARAVDGIHSADQFFSPPLFAAARMTSIIALYSTPATAQMSQLYLQLPFPFGP